MFYDNPFLFDSGMYLRKHRQKKRVIHQQTCPFCGRKLVNLYPGFVTENKGTHQESKRLKWKCKKCWDKEGEIDGY